MPSIRRNVWSCQQNWNLLSGTSQKKLWKKKLSAAQRGGKKGMKVTHWKKYFCFLAMSSCIFRSSSVTWLCSVPTIQWFWMLCTPHFALLLFYPCYSMPAGTLPRKSMYQVGSASSRERNWGHKMKNCEHLLKAPRHSAPVPCLNHSSWNILPCYLCLLSELLSLQY